MKSIIILVSVIVILAANNIYLLHQNQKDQDLLSRMDLTCKSMDKAVNIYKARYDSILKSKTGEVYIEADSASSRSIRIVNGNKNNIVITQNK